MAGTFVLLRSVARYPNATSFDLEIFQSAHRSNLAKGITGRLHKESGCFFHYLEGENEALQNLLDRMRQDDRHFAIQELQRGEFEFPLFTNWDMGFCKGNHACIRQLLGSLPFENAATSVANEIIGFMADQTPQLSLTS